jgi:hypothetical protein
MYAACSRATWHIAEYRLKSFPWDVGEDLRCYKYLCLWALANDINVTAYRNSMFCIVGICFCSVWTICDLHGALPTYPHITRYIHTCDELQCVCCRYQYVKNNDFGTLLPAYLSSSQANPDTSFMTDTHTSWYCGHARAYRTSCDTQTPY